MSEQDRAEHCNPGAGASPDPARLRPSAQPRGGRRRFWRRWVGRPLDFLTRGAALAAILGLKFAVCDSNAVDCVTAPRDTGAGLLASVCGREYEKTGDPAAGVAYVRALYLAKDDTTAAAVASALLATPARADALHLLGKIATRARRYDEATSSLQRSRELHLAEKRFFEAAADEHALASVLMMRERYAEALQLLDHCIKTARTSGNRLIEGYCHLSAGYTLHLVGVARGAREELKRAEPLLEAARDLAALHVELGNLNQDQEDFHAQAVVDFERALVLAQPAEMPDLALTIRVNLAYSLARIGRTEEASRHMVDARVIDHRNERLGDRLSVEAFIAHRRGDGAHAISLVEQAARLPKEDDNQRLNAVLAARIALANGDLATAERWARRGIDFAERTRQAQSSIELRSWMLSRLRAPYDLLFSALARAGRVEEALVVFDQRFGRTLGDAIARPLGGEHAGDLSAVALETAELHALLPSLSAAPLMSTRDSREVVEAVRSVDLLAVIVADDEVWRLTSSSGRFELKNLGPTSILRPLFIAFITYPTERDHADRLGELLLPDDLLRETPEALRVVVDGPFARLPVAALRRRGRPLIAIRPVVRAARLSDVGCIPPMPPPRNIKVIADAQGDLPRARSEAQTVASLFGTEAIVGPAATREALLAGPRPDLFHLAVHSVVGAAGGALKMYDKEVSALEIIARGLSSERVVLSGCATGMGGDVDGATSLAVAFLAGGARQVLATLRPVTDEGAEETTAPFYAIGGATNPVQALAAVQKTLADGPNSDWPKFVVFGRDICQTKP